MSDDSTVSLAARIADRLGGRAVRVVDALDEVTVEVGHGDWLPVARELRDDLGFEQLMDLCAVDYLGYGVSEWDVDDVSAEGFSRGVEGAAGSGRLGWNAARLPAAGDARRFAVVVHLLSVSRNERLRLRCFAPDDLLPAIASLTPVWPGVDWFEREAFDLFGIVFEGHPDLRRILTDYGFIGHPFRKDFPLIGNVEVRYDPDRGRVVYEPVTSVEPRVLVPRVIREDARYQTARGESAQRDGGQG